MLRLSAWTRSPYPQLHKQPKSKESVVFATVRPASLLTGSHGLAKVRLLVQEIREFEKKLYKKYWGFLDRRQAWRHPAYLRRKNMLLLQENSDRVVVQREVMPGCVTHLVRDLYPNPEGIPYMGHNFKWC